MRRIGCDELTEISINFPVAAFADEALAEMNDQVTNVQFTQDLPRTHSIETFRWNEDDDRLIKTYYAMPAGLGPDDDPYELLLGKDNVIANEAP